MKVPGRAIPLGAVLGGFGYLLFEETSKLLNSSISGYFLGTLFMAVFSELLARRVKMPATIFITPAIIPIVPGLGLYSTMLYLVEGQQNKAAQTGISTILSIVAMAMALVLTSLFTKAVHKVRHSVKGHR